MWLLELFRALAVRQRCSRIEVTTELLGLLVYGGDRKSWPKDWHAVVLEDWRRVTGMPAIRGRPKVGPLVLRLPSGAVRPMQPFVIQIEADGTARFDFRNRLTEEEAAARRQTISTCLKATQNPVEIARLRADLGRARPGSTRFAGFRACYAPARIFGPSPRVGLTVPQARLLDALTYETCRTRKRTFRPDQARVWNAESRRGRPPTAPPWLHGRFVAFNGNGQRHLYGRGYRLARRMLQAGYPADTPAKAYLDDLIALAEPFELTTAGYRNGRWYTLAELRRLHRSPRGRTRLSQLLLRVYTASDYLGRWRKYMSDRILAGTTAKASPAPVPS